MDRRSFLTRSLALSTAALLPGRVFANDTKSRFAEALRHNPALLAYRSAAADSFDSQARLTGSVPAGLEGTLFRNGPARHEIGDFRYGHWFDGDGMLQAFRLTPDGIRHQARMIQTRKYQAEQAAGRALYPGFASVPPNPAPVTSADTVNSGNISVLPHGGNLYALWEAGSAWRMNPDTLETEGLQVFSPESQGLPFSAHPRVEPDGTLWNFGYVSAAHLIVLWHIAADGRLKNIGTVPCDPISMPHDFVVTERHIVILIPPFEYENRGGATFLDAHTWHPERPTRVMLVDKNDFSRVRWLELPAQWVFHFGNAWEDKAGVIRFDGARAIDPMVMIDSFRAIMSGAPSTPTHSRHHLYRIDTRSGSATETPMFTDSLDTEFPVIDPRVSCRHNSRLLMLSSDPHSDARDGVLNCVSLYDAAMDRLSTFRYPASVIPEEHLFVPEPGSAPESSGWIIGSSLNCATARTEFRIFDVNNLTGGPLVTAELPYALPLGLHGKFI
ncbi:MAG: carotenoid oxygenase family protein [Pseudomonadales bacterium]|nr:carotenoid oxygenase family protein [Pseudomonadales bacterium]